MSARETAALAFAAYETGRIDRETLIECLEDIINAVALDNGYAAAHGLPCEARVRQVTGPEVNDDDSE